MFSRLPAGDFAPLFRLLDDYDVHRSNTSQQSAGGTPTFSPIRAFQPKFDVREVKDAYELQGELPGIDQKDVQIEFVDAHTLVIKGRTEREYTQHGPSAGAIEGSGSEQGRITDASSSSERKNSSAYHKATVEDDNAPSSTSDAGATNGTSSSTDVATTGAKNNNNGNNKKSNEPQYKYWVSERSIGEFHRSFSFPSRVDQDAVKASLKNGILSIVVPKAAAKSGSKRIQITE